MKDFILHHINFIKNRWNEHREIDTSIPGLISFIIISLMLGIAYFLIIYITLKALAMMFINIII